MAMTNSKVYNAYSQKKKNSLSPYLEAGNSAMGGSTTSSNTQSTGGGTRLYNAYAGAGTQPKATTKVARAYSMNSSPADTAYRSAASPTNEYQQGEILRKSVESGNANNTQPQSALTGAGPAGTALYRAYGSQNGSYSGQRQSALRQAENNYNKLLNYLPEYNELMGMRGLGVSEQALLNAQNNYMQNVADINAQYDELEQAYRDTQISNINNLSGELSDYIQSAGDNFTQEGYDRFKQGLLQAGYTEQEMAAAESLLQQADWAIIDNYNANKNTANQGTNTMTPSASLKASYGITGDGFLASTAKEELFGNYYDTGKEGTKQYQLVQDILKAAREGRIPNGTYIAPNYGWGSNTFYVYLNGYFYPTKDPHLAANYIIGRGGNGGALDPNDL